MFKHKNEIFKYETEKHMLPLKVDLDTKNGTPNWKTCHTNAPKPGWKHTCIYI